MANVIVDDNSLYAIARAIREKNGKLIKYKPSEMANAISNISGGGGGDLPAEALTISGDCSYRFASNGWNWFIQQYGNQITTNNINDASYMFIENSTITEIPFDLNFDSNSSYHNLNYMFHHCDNLTQIPKLNNVKVCNMRDMFSNCHNLREIPEDIADTWDWSYIESLTQPYDSVQSYIFQNCYSLRSVPLNLIKSGNPYTGQNVSYYVSGFEYCYVLDELINLPIPYTKKTWTLNGFGRTFDSCYRLKNVTFALNNGVPYTVTWKNQIIDLSDYVGWSGYKNNILDHNSGITADKEVTDDATYQALKNDPDWFTTKREYSRYNHDSAVRTINSLPDTSAYLATAGGTNTIKFEGVSGTNTDGGAINTLTESEIAVATARGWTLSFA